MIIEYMGHSFFTVTLESGLKIAFDPYGTLENYPARQVKADVCLISHHHFDHDGMNCISGSPAVYDQPGYYRPAAGVTVRGIETAHDHHGGAHRGKNTVMVLEAEDLCLVHLGDLGHLPGPGLIAEIGQPDVLFLPVGGYYTVDAREAEQVRALLGPAVTIPMHYRTEYNPGMKIAPLSDYLSVSGAEDTGAKLLRVTRQDLSERPAVLTMDVR